MGRYVPSSLRDIFLLLTAVAGPDYKNQSIYDLDQMQPYSLRHLYTEFAQLTSDMVFFLPRQSNLEQIAEFAAEENKAQVMQYCMEGASKALCVYYGNFAEISSRIYEAGTG